MSDRSLVLLVLLAWVGCGPTGDARPDPDGDDGTTGEGSTSTTTTTPEMFYTPDEAGMRALFDDACVTCHAPGESAAAIPLPDALEDDLVSGAGFFVVPGDPMASRLWRVVSDQLEEGDLGVMPETGALEARYVAHVEVWIADGAPWDLPALDADGDGFVDEEDCDDADDTVHPDADELCDGIDNDCDGVTDPDTSLDATTWYLDADGDGYGDSGYPTVACEAPADHVAVDGDCDDTDSLFHPGAPEDDCTDPTDYNCDGYTGAVDDDGDGYAACVECDDGDPYVNPGADEVCGGVDEDCDGTVDEADAVDALTWFFDGDGDGYGDPTVTTDACTEPYGYVANTDDCDDLDPYVNPDQTWDPADGIDNDCDGLLDEDAATSTGSTPSYSHAVDIQPIWDVECAGCHGGIAPSGGLDLSGDAYGDIVGVPSGDVPTMDLIEPGDPASSYLWHKLMGSQLMVGGAGNTMPQGGNLTQAELDLIELWILGGALP